MANKRAFLVGINEYKPAKFNLRGCVNDTHSLKALLCTHFGFQEADVTLLLDNQATSQNIKTGLKTLVQGAQAGDVLVFGFAGHGTQGEGVNAEGETDKLFEALVPHDVSISNLIGDFEIDKIIKEHITNFDSIDFTAIYDCCHSGTMFREFKFDRTNQFDEEGIAEVVINRTITMIDLEGLRDIIVAPYNVFSACKDDETAADLRLAPGVSMPRGAFSYALHKIVSDNREVKIKDLDDPIKTTLQAISKHKQTPQFGSSDTDRKLFRLP